MKRYPLANKTEIHVYVTESVLPNTNAGSLEAFRESIDEHESEYLEYNLTGIEPNDSYEIAAEKLIEFIRPHSCRHSLNSLFVALGKEILKDLESIKDLKTLSEQSKGRKDEFKEQYNLLSIFLNKFKKV